MTFRHQLLATVLASLLAAPSWPSAGTVVGVAGPSRAAIVRGTAMSPGTTLFSGDLVTVEARGEAAVSFGQGSMARLSEETTLRLAKDSNRVIFELTRGRVAFRSSEQLPVDGRVADATVSSANGQMAVGIIDYRSSKRAVITAQKGALLIATAHDSRNVSLREGESAEMLLDRAPDQEQRNAGATPASSRTTFIVISVIVLGTALGVGLAVSAGENTLSANEKQNLVSPFQFPPH